MAITRIQFLHQYQATSGTAYPFTSNNTAGNFIIIAVSGIWSSMSATPYAVSDSQGNTYSPLTANQVGAGGNSTALQLFYSPNIKAGANSITVTAASTYGDIGFTAVEYSGIKTSSPLDVESTPVNSSTTTTTITSNSFSPTAGSLIFAAYANEAGMPGTITGTGITIIQTDNGHYDSQGENLSASAGSQTVSFNLANSTAGSPYLMNTASFLPATTSPLQLINVSIMTNVSTITS